MGEGCGATGAEGPNALFQECTFSSHCPPFLGMLCSDSGYTNTGCTCQRWDG